MVLYSCLFLPSGVRLSCWDFRQAPALFPGNAVPREALEGLPGRPAKTCGQVLTEVLTLSLCLPPQDVFLWARLPVAHILSLQLYDGLCGQSHPAGATEGPGASWGV